MDIKTLCLGVLTFGEHTGYEIKKHFEEAFSHFFAAGYGSIYPALASLTAQELVSCTSVEQDKRPDKKVYRLTDAGRAQLVETLRHTYPAHKIRSEFLVLLYFSELLTPTDMRRVLEQRAGDIDDMLDTLTQCSSCGVPGHEFAVGLAQATLQAQRDYIAAHSEALLESLATSESVA